MLAYYFGSKYGLSFFKKYGKYVMISESVLESIKNILSKNLSWGAILSRFYAWTRGVLPFIAGSLKLPFKKILLYTGISNILWTTCFVLVGYLLGASYEAMANSIGAFMT